MLFLAVFCGFLAENFREHQVEKERGRQYILSLYEDLKTDTAGFEGIIRSYTNQINAFKQAESCYESLARNNHSDSCLLNLIFNSSGFADLVFSDRTLQQLKNAGGLRLLKRNDADSILIYDNLLRMYMKIETTAFQEVQYKVRDMTILMLNHKLVNHWERYSKYPVQYVKNPEIINQYFNLLSVYDYYCHDNLKRMVEIKNKASMLIEYFKKEYQLT